MLRVIGTKLQDELDISTAAIDDVDPLGRTALYWAARRGDCEAAKLLTDYGARCELPSARKGSGPLLAAATSGNEDIVRLLLDHGANVETSNADNEAPLICASTIETGLECVKLLIAAGADVNRGDNDNRAPFHRATQNGCIEVSKTLLAAGADINATCEDGWTALACCIFWNTHESIELLLDRGADTLAVTDSGESILHLAAQYADETTLNNLAGRNIGLLDCDAWTGTGESAHHFAGEREETNEWRLAFENLMQSVQGNKAPPAAITTGIMSDPDLSLFGLVETKPSRSICVEVEEVMDDTSDCE